MRFGLERMSGCLNGGRPERACRQCTSWEPTASRRRRGSRLPRLGAGPDGRLLHIAAPARVLRTRHGDGALIAADRFKAAVRVVAEAIEQMDAGASADDRVTQFEAVWAIAFCAYRAPAAMRSWSRPGWAEGSTPPTRCATRAYRC